MDDFKLHAVKDEDGGINITLNGNGMDALRAVGSIICAISELTGVSPEHIAADAIFFNKHNNKITSQNNFRMRSHTVEAALRKLNREMDQHEQI